MPMNTEELLRILACPRCLGTLEALTRDGRTEGFACQACRVVYPVRDDIPVMLVEEAVPRAQWDQGAREKSAAGHAEERAGERD
ncbi:MAG: glycine cleavage system protein H [Desulfovibrio sp.]|uniref:Trm112 family protein n=1 Tax=Desulfovibrio sp. TaxID=885 RepID=UPI0025BA48D6|nr:Trm112 family protein [Desulfovibrio sp.]MBS6830030.1 glycine cleavage system protein H [Desulfovibrio sp.]